MDSELFWAIVPWVVLLGFVWWYLMRPQQIKQKEREEMLNSLRVGDEVVTIGGIHGTITRLHDDMLRLRVAEGVELTLTRTSVSRVLEEAAAVEEEIGEAIAETSEASEA